MKIVKGCVELKILSCYDIISKKNRKQKKHVRSFKCNVQSFQMMTLRL